MEYLSFLQILKQWSAAIRKKRTDRSRNKQQQNVCYVSDNESDIDNLLEDSDTEYVAEEPVPETKEDNHNIPTSEANIHIEGTTFCCNTELPKKKLKQKIDSLKWERTAKLIKPKKCELQAKILLDFSENDWDTRVLKQQKNYFINLKEPN